MSTSNYCKLKKQLLTLLTVIWVAPGRVWWWYKLYHRHFWHWILHSMYCRSSHKLFLKCTHRRIWLLRSKYLSQVD